MDRLVTLRSRPHSPQREMDERSLPRSPERRYDHIKISNYRRGDAYPPNHAEPIDITIALRQVFLFFSLLSSSAHRQKAPKIAC